MDSPATLHGGTRIDRYEIFELLGSGGFGAVYRARHVHTQQFVALKILRTAARTSAPAWEALLKEARAIARLGHPNIVRVFDCAVSESGAPFLVMELIEGNDLGRLLAREGRPIASPRAVSLALQVLAALSAAHEQGIVHRDVKPANIFVTSVHDASGASSEQVKLVDFGISKIRDDASVRTAPGMSIGTPGYMAPEQLADAAQADPRSDVYAVCVVLYEMLAGHPPFVAANVQTLMTRVLTERAPPLSVAASHVPAALAAVVDCGLAREPAARWASVSQLMSALQPFANPRTAFEPPRDQSTMAFAPTMAIATPVAPPILQPVMPPSAPMGFAGPPPRSARSGTTRMIVLGTVGVVLAAGIAVGAFLLGRGERIEEASVAVEAPASVGSSTPSTPTMPNAPSANETLATAEGVRAYGLQLNGWFDRAHITEVIARAAPAMSGCRVADEEAHGRVQISVNSEDVITAVTVVNPETEADRAGATCIGVLVSRTAPTPWTGVGHGTFWFEVQLDER